MVKWLLGAVVAGYILFAYAAILFGHGVTGYDTLTGKDFFWVLAAILTVIAMV